MKLLFLHVLFLLLFFNTSKAAQNYQPQKNIINQPPTNTLKERLDNRYNISQQCSFVEEVNKLVCTNNLTPVIPKLHKPKDVEEKSPITQVKRFTE
ncbi:MAG: hypothetical protein LBH40_03175 [Alphaproteobacteria bacterium]|jgi:tRNA A37 N6-isopentenylltransferase MiaA|nr:hypothetical protein [Alphaproteobacteria bacterium]